MTLHNTSASIEVLPYTSAWTDKFAAEQAVLKKALWPWLVGPIEHVGSTAVPGLAAKPVIDIMAAVQSLDDSRPAIEQAEALGYNYWPYKAEVMHWLCKPSDVHRTHHLHLVPYNSPLWHARLGFRNALRADADLAHEYATLKFSLASKHPHDREAYTQGKTGFVQQVLDSIDLG